MKKIITLVVFLFSLGSFAQTGVDRIFMVDRSIKEGTIISIDDNLVTFQEKSNAENRTTIRIATIWKIIYSNGFEEQFNSPLPENLLVDKKENQEESRDKVIPVSSGPTFLDKLASNQDWRPLISVDLGGLSPVLIGPDGWTSLDEGLAFRFGFGGEFGISINPIKNLGISISQGYGNHISYLPAIPITDSTSTEKEQLVMTSMPTTIRLNVYLSRKFSITGGIITSGISITNSNPELSNQRLSGYTAGLGKLVPLGNKKNYLEFSLNYSLLTANEPFQFQLDNEKLPQYESLSLELNELTVVDFKVKFHFGIVN